MNGLPGSRFLDVDAMVRLARYRFAPRYIVEGPYPGRHASRHSGGALEFADYRAYTPGDDLRKLDWKVLGRTGRAYVRTFHEDTELLCTLVVDASRSMLFGADGASGQGSSKLDFARRLAASLGFVIARSSDAVGVASIAGGLCACLPPAASPRHFQGFLAAIEAMEPERSTHLGQGLRALLPALPRRGVLVLLSDFLDDDLEGAFAALRLFKHRHFEVLCLHLVHPAEERLPEGAAFRFIGLEGEPAIVSSPPEITDEYARRFARFLAEVKTLALATRCDYRRLSTGTSYLGALESLLVEREG